MAHDLPEAALDPGALARVQETFTRLARTGALPALPEGATTALALARDPDADLKRLAAIIERDVGLAARILRLANSFAQGRREPARTLHAAVVTIGMRQTCDVLVAACAKQFFGSAGRTGERLWKHALAVAVATQELARRARGVDAGAVFVPALFHDVGRIALLIADRHSFELVQRLAQEGRDEPHVLEREWYGFDHAEAGSILATEWALAAEQCSAIRWHHDPAQAERGQELAALINAGDALAYALGLGAADEPPPSVAQARTALAAKDETACRERVAELFAQHYDLLR